jgi:three-Cys-motif partner protein
MPHDIFDDPFDEGTLVKLEIFEDYFKEWLPVFISKPDPYWKQIQIFDLFAGQGKDVGGKYGSPLRILSILNENADRIRNSQVQIKVVLNEFDPRKYQQLKDHIELLWDKSLYTVEHYRSDFLTVFNNYYESMRNTANFIFLDQNGIKHITEEIFVRLTSLQKTDILFFISSSYIKRFGDLEEFKRYLKITRQDFDGKSYHHIHRIVLNYYRSLVPKGKVYFLAPFSIKKPAGIYGLIFGTNHQYGLEKFLSTCWKHDKLTGEANFDIDNEKINLNAPSLYSEFNVPSKRQVFENNLRQNILSGVMATNHDVYLFALNEGFQLKDVNAVLRELEQGKKISINFKLITNKLHKQPLGVIKLL